MEPRITAAGRRPWARTLSGLGLAAVLALGAGCGGAATSDTGSPSTDDRKTNSAPIVVRPATLLPGQAVPMPVKKSLLTVSGKVSAGNRGTSILLDRAALELMGLVQVRVYEPWVKREVDFRGVWLQDLLKVAGAAEAYSKLRFTALDDYQVDLTAADVRAGGILLATSAGDGTEIPVDKGGPTRIIFVGGVKAGANADQWIWSLKTIDVE